MSAEKGMNIAVIRIVASQKHAQNLCRLRQQTGKLRSPSKWLINT